jgi:predicted MFS family arabinose efflux permease
VAVTAFVIRPSPESIGLQPDGILQTIAEGTTFADAISSWFFFAVTAAFTCAFAAQLGAIAHLFRLVSLRAETPTAALAVALLAGASLLGRLAGGWLLAIVPAKAFSLGLMLVQAVALALLAYALSKEIILVAAALFGAGIGNILMMQQLLMAEAFGTKDYARIYALSQLIAVAGIACGPPLVGYVNQATGGYTAAYAAVALVSLAGFFILAASGQAAGRRTSISSP